MAKFPVDAPIDKVVKTFEKLGFRLIRENQDGTRTPLTMPNHRKIKGSTLRTILTQSGVSRDEFLDIYRKL